MTRDESKALAKFIKELFPEVTEGQLLWAAELAQHLPFLACAAVVKQHRGLHAFFECPAFKTGLEAAHAKALPASTAEAHERVLDWLRRENPDEWADADAMGDRELLEAHFRAGAKAVGRTPYPAESKARALAMLDGHAVEALVQIGVGLPEARELAREWAEAVTA